MSHILSSCHPSKHSTSKTSSNHVIDHGSNNCNNYNEVDCGYSTVSLWRLIIKKLDLIHRKRIKVSSNTLIQHTAYACSGTDPTFNTNGVDFRPSRTLLFSWFGKSSLVGKVTLQWKFISEKWGMSPSNSSDNILCPNTWFLDSTIQGLMFHINFPNMIKAIAPHLMLPIANCLMQLHWYVRCTYISISMIDSLLYSFPFNHISILVVKKCSNILILQLDLGRCRLGFDRLNLNRVSFDFWKFYIISSRVFLNLNRFWVQFTTCLNAFEFRFIRVRIVNFSWSNQNKLNVNSNLLTWINWMHI